MPNKAPQKPFHPSQASVGKARLAKSSGNQSNKAPLWTAAHKIARFLQDNARRPRSEFKNRI